MSSRLLDAAGFQGLSRRTTLLGLASMLASPWGTEAAERNASQPLFELDQPTSAELEKSLRRVLEELRSVVEDPSINRLLNNLALKMDREVFSPNARASSDNGQPQVLIDVSLLIEVMQEADLAAAMWLRFPMSDAIISEALKAYGFNLGIASRTNRSPPTLGFMIDKAGFPPLETTALKQVSLVIEHTTLAWIILHEVGHHVLGHTKHRPTPEQSRLDELAADRFGVEALIRIGYSPEPLLKLLELRVAQAQLSRIAGYVLDDPGNTHPPWDWRADQIDALSKGHVIPDFPIQAIQWCAEAADGSIFTTSVMFMTDPTITRSIAAIGGATSGFAGYERRGNTVTVYTRAASYRQEITIEHTDRFAGDVAVRTITPNSDTTLRCTAFNMNFATRKRGLGGKNVFDVLILSTSGLREFNKRQLGSDIGARVDQVQAGYARRILIAYLDYCKGVIDLREYARRANAEQVRSEAEQRRVIGDRNYPAYRSAVERFLRENLPTEAVLGRLYQMKEKNDAVP